MSKRNVSKGSSFYPPSFLVLMSITVSDPLCLSVMQQALQMLNLQWDYTPETPSQMEDILGQEYSHPTG